MQKKIMSILLATMVVISGLWIPETTSFAAGEETVINIIHTNDTHGRMKNDGKDVIGIDTVAKVKQSMSNAFLVDAGDTLHGLPFVTMSKGEDPITLMNLAGYDFMTVGNHDFNYGYERLLELEKKANFSILAGNVKNGTDSLFKGSEIRDMDGVKVGFFGLASPETAYKTNPNNIKGIEFIDPIAAAQEQVTALKNAGAELIVAIAHIGMDGSTEVKSTDIAENVDGIDVIIDGHSHHTLENGQMVGNTLIASANEYLKYIGHVTITYNKATKEVVKKEASLLEREEALIYGQDETVEAKIAEISKVQDVILSEKIGETTVHLEGERENVRTKETNLGNLIADSMVAETGADLSITNGGGIRSSIKVGNITKGDVVKVLPFGNYIVTKSLTGAQIKAVLEHGVKDYPAVSGVFPHVAGVTFTFDWAQPAGNRIVELKVNGKAIENDKKYLVATNDFLAAGGDGYPAFKEVQTENEFNSLEEVLASFINKNGNVASEVEGRSNPINSDKMAAQPIIEEIDALPTAIMLEHKTLVAALRANYDSLTEGQKALVTNYEKLVAAEAVIVQLEEAAKPVPPTVEDETAQPDVEQPSEDKEETPTPESENPETGDSMNLFFMMGLFLSAIGALFILRKKVRA